MPCPRRAAFGPCAALVASLKRFACALVRPLPPATHHATHAHTHSEKGFIRLKRQGADAKCGTDLSPGDGSGCHGGPPTVKVCGTCGVLYDTAFPIIG